MAGTRSVSPRGCSPDRTAHTTTVAATAFALLLVLPSLLQARDQKTVFHGMAIEPDTGLGRNAIELPIKFSRVWAYEGFKAPLAGQAASGSKLVAADRSGEIVMLGADDGQVAWKGSVPGPLSIPPAWIGATIYQVTAAGMLYALDAADGSERWHTALGAEPIAPPEGGEDLLLVATVKPELITVREADGTIAGRLDLPGRPVPPTIADGVAIVGTDHGRVLAIDIATLTTRWDRYLANAITAPALVTEKHLYVVAADHTLRSLRLKSGRQRWRQRTGSAVTARLLAAGEFIYALCYDNDIYVLRGGSGHLAGRVHLDHRLSHDAIRSGDHLFVTPFTEGTVVGLTLPYLAVAGKFNLESPGEWFTTPPAVVSGDRIAVGYGRDAGRIVSLLVEPAPRENEKGPASAAPPGH